MFGTKIVDNWLINMLVNGVTINYRPHAYHTRLAFGMAEIRFPLQQCTPSQVVSAWNSQSYDCGSSLNGQCNILGQGMNLVNTLQCCPSRGWQHVAPEVDLLEDTMHYSMQCNAMRISQNQNLEESSQKSNTSGPKAGYASVTDKKLKVNFRIVIFRSRPGKRFV